MKSPSPLKPFKGQDRALEEFPASRKLAKMLKKKKKK
jgi:hypothetical protein